MFMNNFSGRERKLAIITISVVSAGLLYTLMIAPLYSKWRGVTEQIRAKSNLLESGIKMLANQKQLREEHSKLSRYAKSASSDEQAIADTLAYIETISRNDSCLIVNIKPAGITKTDSCKEILIDISAEANISQFLKFIYDIENPRDALITIKRFALSPKSGQSDTLKGSLQIRKILLA